jgi:hypothetical protein
MIMIMIIILLLLLYYHYYYITIIIIIIIIVSIIVIHILTIHINYRTIFSLFRIVKNTIFYHSFKNIFHHFSKITTILKLDLPNKPYGYSERFYSSYYYEFLNCI